MMLSKGSEGGPQRQWWKGLYCLLTMLGEGDIDNAGKGDALLQMASTVLMSVGPG